jgi:hypothetical protein
LNTWIIPQHKAKASVKVQDLLGLRREYELTVATGKSPCCGASIKVDPAGEAVTCGNAKCGRGVTEVLVEVVVPDTRVAEGWLVYP